MEDNEKVVKKKSKIEINNGMAIPLIIAIIHWIISFFTDTLIFRINIFSITSTYDILRLIIMKLISLILYIFLWKYLILFGKRVKNKEKNAIEFLKIFLIYFGINIVLLILSWPGIWRWDEFNILQYAAGFRLEYWQHYLTSIFYILSFMIIPIPSGVIIMQIIVVSGIVAYIVANFKKLFNNSKWTYLLFIPFLLLPVLDTNLYPLRLSIYTYIELALVCQLIFMKKLGKKSKRDFAVLSIILIILSVWRSEGILFLVLVPILFFFIFKEELKEIKIRAMYTIFVIAVSTALIIPQNYVYKTQYSDRYDVTSYINQLYVVCLREMEENPDSEQLKTIAKVIDYSELYKYTRGIYAHNNEKVYKTTATEADYEAMKQAYNELLKKYPLDVLNERIDIFLKTSGFVKDYNVHVEDTRTIFTRPANYTLHLFRTMYDAAKPINSELRNSVISFLECFDGEHTNWAFHIFYNVVPSMIILAIGIIVCLIKKKWALFFTLGVILAKVFVIILTAPDCFFMYYLPAYLVGAFLLWLFIVQCIVNRQNKENKVKLLV